MTREVTTGDYTQAVSGFKALIEYSSAGSMDRFNPKDGWEVMGDDVEPDNIYPNKLVAVNDSLGLFVKIYPADYRSSKGYAEAAFKTLKELGQLTDLPYPVLQPLALEQDVLVFPEGIESGVLRYQDLPLESQDKISSVVEKNSLQPLWPRSKILMINVKGVDYLADPFEDSVNSIMEFTEMQQRKQDAAERATLRDTVSEKTIPQAREFIDEVRRLKGKKDSKLTGDFGHKVINVAGAVRTFAAADMPEEVQLKSLMAGLRSIVENFSEYEIMLLRDELFINFEALGIETNLEDD